MHKMMNNWVIKLPKFVYIDASITLILAQSCSTPVLYLLRNPVLRIFVFKLRWFLSLNIRENFAYKHFQINQDITPFFDYWKTKMKYLFIE